MVKVTVELGEVHRSNWGAPEDVTLVVKNAATGDFIANVRYEFVEAGEDEPVTMQVGAVRCEADPNAPGDPIYIAALALQAAYKQCAVGDYEFLADVFESSSIIEFEV